MELNQFENGSISQLMDPKLIDSSDTKVVQHLLKVDRSRYRHLIIDGEMGKR